MRVVERDGSSIIQSHPLAHHSCNAWDGWDYYYYCLSENIPPFVCICLFFFLSSFIQHSCQQNIHKSRSTHHQESAMYVYTIYCGLRLCHRKARPKRAGGGSACVLALCSLCSQSAQCDQDFPFLLHEACLLSNNPAAAPFFSFHYATQIKNAMEGVTMMRSVRRKCIVAVVGYNRNGRKRNGIAIARELREGTSIQWDEGWKWKGFKHDAGEECTVICECKLNAVAPWRLWGFYELIEV